MKSGSAFIFKEMANNSQLLLRCLLSFLLVLSSDSFLAVTVDTEQRKVVLIGIDGLNYEALKR